MRECAGSAVGFVAGWLPDVAGFASDTTGAATPASEGDFGAGAAGVDGGAFGAALSFLPSSAGAAGADAAAAAGFGAAEVGADVAAGAAGEGFGTAATGVEDRTPGVAFSCCPSPAEATGAGASVDAFDVDGDSPADSYPLWRTADLISATWSRVSS